MTTKAGYEETMSDGERFAEKHLGAGERQFYRQMLAHRQKASSHLQKEIEFRDKLIVSLHGRLAYATERIRQLLGVSTYFVKTELSRLREAGRLR